jgi:hypothetical protein
MTKKRKGFELAHHLMYESWRGASSSLARARAGLAQVPSSSRESLSRRFIFALDLLGLAEFELSDSGYHDVMTQKAGALLLPDGGICH